MHRWIIRICAFAFSLILGICSIQTTQDLQKAALFNSTVVFNLAIQTNIKTKDALASDLSAIGTNLHTTIGKVSPNKEHYTTESDVILFSGNLDSQSGPVVKQNKIYWLNQNISGQLISYKEMGDRSLNGDYFAINTPRLRQAIQSWAQANAIHVS